MMSDDDVEISDLPCPACRHDYTHFRRCYSCEDGLLDMHDDDPINYAPFEEYEDCPECRGLGYQRWCPKCGVDYSVAKAAALKSGTIFICHDIREHGHDDCPSCHGNGWVFADRVKAEVQA